MSSIINTTVNTAEKFLDRCFQTHTKKCLNGKIIDCAINACVSSKKGPKLTRHS